jgi:hypothetical protein
MVGLLISFKKIVIASEDGDSFSVCYLTIK